MPGSSLGLVTHPPRPYSPAGQLGPSQTHYAAPYADDLHGQAQHQPQAYQPQQPHASQAQAHGQQHPPAWAGANGNGFSSFGPAHDAGASGRLPPDLAHSLESLLPTTRVQGIQDGSGGGAGAGAGAGASKSRFTLDGHMATTASPKGAGTGAGVGMGGGARASPTPTPVPMPASAGGSGSGGGGLGAVAFHIPPFDPARHERATREKAAAVAAGGGTPGPGPGPEPGPGQGQGQVAQAVGAAR